MRILIIRHADPDYEADSLTSKGWREAELLTERLMRERVSRVYVSPLGRARATCSLYCERAGIEPKVMDWLTEFNVTVDLPGGGKSLTWNLQPAYWTAKSALYTHGWEQESPYRESGAPARFHEMSRGLDGLMLSEGYERTGGYFTRLAECPEKDETIALVCHQGAGQVVLSLLTGIPLPVFLHTFFLPTSSVSTAFMECWNQQERAYIPRVISLGDLSHLYAGGEPVSFAGLIGTPWFNAVPHRR